MSGKTAVITGATSGIGAVYAREFAKQGYDLVITGRRGEIIGALAKELGAAYGVSVDVVLAELSEEAGIQKVINAMQGKTVEILVNNAGFGVSSLFQSSDLAAMEQLTRVNTLAPLALTHAVLPGMVARGSGIIINISSESVYMAIPKNGVYAGAKAFLKTFTEGLWLDLQGTGVTALAVCPGLTHTDFHEKMGIPPSRQKDHGPVRWSSPESVVQASLKDLAKDRVVSIPGLRTRMLTRFLNLLPKKAYYRFMLSFSRKNFGKKAKSHD